MEILGKVSGFNINIQFDDNTDNMPWSLQSIPTLYVNKENNQIIIKQIQPDELLKEKVRANRDFIVALAGRWSITEQEINIAIKRLLVKFINSSPAFYFGKRKPNRCAIDINNMSVDVLTKLASIVDLTCANADKMFEVGALKDAGKLWASNFDEIPFKRHISPNRLVLMRGINDYLDMQNPETPIVIEPEQENIQFKKSVNLFRLRANVIGTEEGACIISESAAKKLTAIKHYISKKKPKFIVPEEKIDIKDIMQNPVSITIYKGDAVIPAEVGDKIVDSYSNKAIISKIIPDENMPIINDKRVEMIFNPNIEKRKNFSCVIEERLSNVAGEGEQLIIENPEEILTNNQYPNETTFKFNGKEYTGFYGTTKFYRPDQIAKEKFEIRKLTLGDVWLKFYAGNKEVLKMLMNRSTRKLEIKRLWEYMTVVGMKFTDNGIEYNGVIRTKDEIDPNWVELKKKLDRKIIPVGIQQELFDPDNFQGTVLDKNTENKMCYIKLSSNQFILFPPTKYTMVNDKLIIDNKRAAFNRIIAEFFSIERNNLKRYVREYEATIQKEMKGRKGKLYNALYPKITAFYGVAYNVPNIDEDTIVLPYNTHPHTRYATVVRMPAHGIHDMHLMKVVYSKRNQNAIGINPHRMKLMDGDFDGDTLYVIPHTKKEYEILLQEKEEIINYTKDFKPFEIVSQKEDSEPYLRGLKDAEVIEKQINAAFKHKNIKRLTALGGSIGILFRDTNLVNNLELKTFIDYGRLYHVIAQTALNEKHNTEGTTSPIERFISGFYMKKDIETIMKSIGEMTKDKDIIQLCHETVVQTLDKANSQRNMLDLMKYRRNLKFAKINPNDKIYIMIKEALNEYKRTNYCRDTTATKTIESTQDKDGKGTILHSASESIQVIQPSKTGSTEQDISNRSRLDMAIRWLWKKMGSKISNITKRRSNTCEAK